MANWKAAGPDLVQGYWFKNLPGIHPSLQLYLQDCVSQDNMLVDGQRKNSAHSERPNKGYSR